MENAISSCPGFRERLVKSLNRPLTTKPACLYHESVCPSCGLDEWLDPVLPGADAFRRPPPGATAPPTSHCVARNSNYKDKDIINSTLGVLAAHDGVHLVARTIDFKKCRPPNKDVRSDLGTSLVVRDVQVHYCNHCRSCFKVSTMALKVKWPTVS
ncbi:hypothetical protein JG688_00004884 [Phytophthora aleatoria]|uniref:Uncharacterized protein n=1 Tax=Phytophthora aleatoria TaxID=2496075 RepID=A0A8J5J1H9_9STRA|nr:hypothetical protein JG688_00004884 [Phytophthora aleatoria]